MNVSLKKLLQLGILGILLIGVALTQSCKEDAASAAYSRVKFFLTDAPAMYDAVFIDIKEVQVNSGSDSSSGWVSLGLIRPGIYNLLDFSNGIDTLLADARIPSGKLSQVRLILGTNNSVVIDSVSYELKTPSAQTSGLKLKVNETLQPDIEYTFHLDFDAARSIVSTGSGKYNLKPVIRVFTEAISGAVSGVVRPQEARPFVFLVAGSDTILSIADTNGNFKLMGVPAGSYAVKFEPTNGLATKTVTGVTVTNGQVTKMDTVRLN